MPEDDRRPMPIFGLLNVPQIYCGFLIGGLVVGFIGGGWLGGLTGITACFLFSVGLRNIELGSPISARWVHSLTRVAGFVSVSLTISGAILGGWRWGWFGAIAGQFVAMLLNRALAVLVKRRASSSLNVAGDICVTRHAALCDALQGTPAEQALAISEIRAIGLTPVMMRVLVQVIADADDELPKAAYAAALFAELKVQAVDRAEIVAELAQLTRSLKPYVKELAYAAYYYPPGFALESDETLIDPFWDVDTEESRPLYDTLQQLALEKQQPLIATWAGNAAATVAPAK